MKENVGAAARAFMEALYEEIWHKGNLDFAEGVYAPGYVAHGPGCSSVGERKSAAEIRSAVAGLRAAFPDIRFRVDNVVAAGGEGTVEIACHYTYSGTHLGTLLGLPPTGRRVEVRGMDMYRLEGGRIVEGWESYDALGLLLQILPETGGPASPAPSSFGPVTPVRRPDVPGARREGWSDLAMLAAFGAGWFWGDG